MDLNKFLFRFISVAFKIMIALFVIAATVKLGGIGYDFGYRVFTESAIDKEPGKDVLVQVREDTSARELGKTLEEKGLVRDGNLFFLQIVLPALVSIFHPISVIISSGVSAIPAPCLKSLLQPILRLSVHLPGTAYTSRPCSNAISTVISVPLFSLASTTNTASDKALMILFRIGKSEALGGIPGVYSEITPPFSMSL